MKWFRSRPSSSVKIFAAAKRPLGTRVPFCSQVHPFRTCEMAAKPPRLEIHHFCSQGAISKGVSLLRNHPLAHECHFTALYTHFTAAKWFQNLYILKSFSAHTMDGNVAAIPPFWQLLDTFLSLPKVHFMHTICRFESWEVISPELETVCNLELKRRSYGCLKMTAQTMSGNVAPPFCNCSTHFGSLP